MKMSRFCSALLKSDSSLANRTSVEGMLSVNGRTACSRVKLFRASMVLLAAMLLIGCQEEYRVTLASPNQTTAMASFSVKDLDETRITSMQSIRVYNQREVLVWHLQRDALSVDLGLNGFQYGATPRGFEVIVPPIPLETGAAYTVVVQGRGYGVLRFAVNAKGQLVHLGTESAGF